MSVTRSGQLSVHRTPAATCSPSSSPRFHHGMAVAIRAVDSAGNIGLSVVVRVRR